jgi:cell wall-associated NlpC family hydrolase
MTGRRAAFARAAESFVGTPFRFRGRDPKSGLDCVGLVLAALEAIGAPIPPIARYALRQRGFAVHLGGLAEAGFGDAEGVPQAGDLLLLRPGPAQAHLAVVGSMGGLVHAHAGIRRVVTTPPPFPWPVERHWRLCQD